MITQESDYDYIMVPAEIADACKEALRNVVSTESIDKRLYRFARWAANGHPVTYKLAECIYEYLRNTDPGDPCWHLCGGERAKRWTAKIQRERKMTNEEYVELALQTETEYRYAQERLQKVDIARLLHAGLGLATEAGEILDQLKKHVYYGKQLDSVNLKEEAGDLLWYLAILSDTLGLDFESIMKTNVAKLKKRYDSGFTSGDALKRDLAAEREILEKAT